MKYNWRKNHYENRKAWRIHAETALRTQYGDLNASELAKIEALHAQLIVVEAKFYPILEAKHRELTARVVDLADWMQEFNLELWLTYYLREDDPEWETDCDNILMQCEYLGNWSAMNDWGFGMLHINHAEPGFPFENPHHCYSFHELYAHCDLDWRDLLRIGNIHVEIKIDEQGGFPV